ncbi:hypothetical protein Acr_08g0011520 [Actinidia rufa]|uniref:Uncharacterized protein n=1 Tax=Actinidia rufa TaxID=165716 RepID=A0A7J0F2X6_9ERIC|nr:hypothetical protein Acr_08g0011520 [Actinidia rufa]
MEGDHVDIKVTVEECHMENVTRMSKTWWRWGLKVIPSSEWKARWRTSDELIKIGNVSTGRVNLVVTKEGVGDMVFIVAM